MVKWKQIDAPNTEQASEITNPSQNPKIGPDRVAKMTVPGMPTD